MVKIKNKMTNKEKSIKEQIIDALEGEREFRDLYNLYLKIWGENHNEGEPVCYEEWVDNELEELRTSYRRYLKEAVLDDVGFDETTTEDFWTFAEEEIENPIW